MKYVFLVFSLFFYFQASGQKLRIENRAGKVVIVRTDTNSAGETREIAEWKANPGQVLQNELDATNQYLEWIANELKRLQNEQKTKQDQQKDLKKAIADLERGIVPKTPAKPKPVKPKPKQ